MEGQGVFRNLLPEKEKRVRSQQVAADEGQEKSHSKTHAYCSKAW